MSSEAIAKTEKRLGKRPQAGLCHWHATGIDLTGAGRRCGATCSGKRRPERRGMPCRAYALKGRKRCWSHGGRNGGYHPAKYSPEVREARKRAQVLESDRLWAKQLAKERQPKPIRREPAPKASLEDVFREGRSRGPKKGWSPY
jgi:hypothetical protein